MTSQISEKFDMPQSVLFDAQGLVPVVAQEEQTGEVLLLAYMNADALRLTLAEGQLVLWSRSRGRLWRKGEQSGHTLRVSEVRLNCEGNSLLARVRLAGPGACHEGYRSCYFRRLEVSAVDGALGATIVEPRTFDPALVYAPSAAPQDDATAAQALERDLRALYLGYTWLRDAELIAGSRTSVLLHAPDTAATAQQTLARAQEELNELRGVLAGTHTHSGGADDVLLEASQVGYWALLAALVTRHSYDEWQPHAAWLAGWNGAAHAAVPSDATLAACVRTLLEAGALCRAAGVHPARAVAVDLAALRAKYTI